MSEVTLELYKREERSLAATEARKGLAIHAAITCVVVCGLIAINIFVASEFPWSVFPAIGMSIGVWFHWYFGVRHGDEFMRRHQDEIEARARRRAA